MLNPPYSPSLFSLLLSPVGATEQWNPCSLAMAFSPQRSQAYRANFAVRAALLPAVNGRVSARENFR